MNNTLPGSTGTAGAQPLQQRNQASTERGLSVRQLGDWGYSLQGQHCRCRSYPPSSASDEDLAPAALPPDDTQTVHDPRLQARLGNLSVHLPNVNRCPWQPKGCPARSSSTQSYGEGETLELPPGERRRERGGGKTQGCGAMLSVHKTTLPAHLARRLEPGRWRTIGGFVSALPAGRP